MNNLLLRFIKKTKILKNYTQIDDYLIIKATKIQSFENFLIEEKVKTGSSNIKISVCLNIIYFLSKQIEYLIKHESKCFYKLDYKNILVIDNKFIYISSEDLKEIEEKKIQIYSIIEKKTGLISPELVEIKKIPAEVNYKTIYYSLGILIISIMFSSKIDELTEIEKYNREKMLELCVSIKETKLYYFIERCLDNVNKRVLLYV